MCVPARSLIFVEPIGLRKAEFARTLTQFMIEKEERLIGTDMSEYMDRFSVYRLVGAPPGYGGYKEGGQLTEAVRRKFVLCSSARRHREAHSIVFHILLQIMEDARLAVSRPSCFPASVTVTWS